MSDNNNKEGTSPATISDVQAAANNLIHEVAGNNMQLAGGAGHILVQDTGAEGASANFGATVPKDSVGLHDTIAGEHAVNVSVGHENIPIGGGSEDIALSSPTDNSFVDASTGSVDSAMSANFDMPLDTPLDGGGFGSNGL